ncbi:hypothetical protein FRZ67_04495 [Panacibacter ginsenosidivorans]|uniref:NYN domain-containing protein n=1 Tax=Panacibacter ginsenosidivorans TaxID=1813871 RepID=A0A5B8V741_9BACT|nr:hypothetical protein [Panacibacter ginsenosidivorans]QEC66591.1 hypothetical protein FRZ67_04495 [Panacibacter ginsenosidivorans]
MPFHVLIDYDNLSYQDTSRQLIDLSGKLISKFSPTEIKDKNITIRLYGGWYENNNITRKAQNLNAEIMRDFPRTEMLSDNKTTVIVNIELATSLTSAPRIELFNTFRRRGFPSGVQSHNPRLKGCLITNCPIVEVYNFFQLNKCNTCNTIRPEHIIFRQEQKLVDTMLTSDLINICQSNRIVSVVSSDDDLWPGILAGVMGGAKVYHMQTKPRATPTHYSRTVTANYFQKNL